MNEALYLALGLGLFSHLSEEKKGGRKRKDPLAENLVFFFAAWAAVVAADFLMTHFLWRPAGRIEFREASLLLVSLLMSRGSERRFLPVAGISLWTVSLESSISLTERLAAGGGLILLMELFRAFLRGAEKRLLFSDTPKILAGLPILFMTAAIGALVLGGLANLLRPFVN